MPAACMALKGPASRRGERGARGPGRVPSEQGLTVPWVRAETLPSLFYFEVSGRLGARSLLAGLSLPARSLRGDEDGEHHVGLKWSLTRENFPLCWINLGYPAQLLVEGTPLASRMLPWPRAAQLWAGSLGACSRGHKTNVWEGRPVPWQPHRGSFPSPSIIYSLLCKTNSLGR